jgi:MOB kinase activator 1
MDVDGTDDPSLISPLECTPRIDILRIIQESVKCPYGVEGTEWAALKLIDMYSELTILCNAISDICTDYTCPVMRAGEYYEYAWGDPTSPEYACPVIVSAPMYIQLLMTWIDRHVTSFDPRDWTRDSSNGFTMKTVCRRMFRVYAHIFSEHLDLVAPVLSHLRYSFCHFIVFMNEFGLLVPVREIEPIRSVIESLGIGNLRFDC